jgi:hypothetical protein
MLFSGAAKAIRVRDKWIGWGTNERLRNLGYVVTNGRFLIFPWVKVRYLASHALGKVVRELGMDWERRWGYRPVLLETFADPQYFVGTSYLAANFIHLGMSSGLGLVRQNKTYTTRKAQRKLREFEKLKGLEAKFHATISNHTCAYERVEEESRARNEAVCGQVRIFRGKLPGLLKRLSKIEDPRNAKKIKHKLPLLMIYGILSFVFQMSSCREANREMTRPMFWQKLN